jgi:dihydroxyacetone kinase
MLTVATFDQHWVKHEDHVKVLVEAESRRMVGQAMYDYITSNEMQYQSITLMAILKNWKKI